MIKHISFLFSTLLVLAACSGKETPVPEPVAVGFSVQESTKAGYIGEANAGILRATGFGVYAYVTPDSDWASAGASTTPRFMTNQKVQYEGVDGWVYRPLKYWPNEAADKVSFFAYAPYVALDALDDVSGIVSLPGKDDVGTPKIGYKVAANPAFGVDLMYGVAASDHTNPSVTAGVPYLDMTKLRVGEKLDFRFKHALTRLVITVDAVSSGAIDWANTRVVIESLVLGDGGPTLYTQGELNLQSGDWEGLTGLVGDLTSLIPSGFKYVSGNENSVTYFTQQPLGVTGSAQSLFGKGVDGTSDAQLLYIPGPASDNPLPLTVKYHVIVRDAGEASGYRTITSNPTVNLSVGFTPGQTTTIHLHLTVAE